MKKYVLLISAVAAVAACALPLIAQEETQQPSQGPRSRGGMQFREIQTQAIGAIEAELAKLKSQQEGMPTGREGFQNLSEEERAQMRERFQKMREDRMKSVAVIEEQLAKLKGSRVLTQEHDQAVETLQSLHKLAVKEEAKETAAAIQKMIDEKNKAFEAMMAKLEMEPRRGGGGPR